MTVSGGSQMSDKGWRVADYKQFVGLYGRLIQTVCLVAEQS